MSEQAQTFNGEQPQFTSIRVLVADDSDLVRRTVLRMLNDEHSVRVVGEAKTFTQMIELCKELKPKVVVLDLHMPDESKFTAEHIKSELINSATHVLAVSLWNDDETKELANSYGAFTLLDKAMLASTLIPTILKIAMSQDNYTDAG